MGRMGYPMAERLLKAGHSVAIWNRTRAKAEPLAKNGGRIVNYSSLFGNDPNYAAKNLIDGEVWSQGDGKGSWGWSSASHASNGPRSQL